MCSTDFVPPSHRSEDSTTAIRISASIAIKMFCSLFTANRRKCTRKERKSVRKKPNPKKITLRKNNKKIKPRLTNSRGFLFITLRIFFAQFAAEPVGKINANQNHRGNHRGIQPVPA